MKTIIQLIFLLFAVQLFAQNEFVENIALPACCDANIYDVKHLSDGYLISGSQQVSEQPDEHYSPFLIKLNFNGDTLWNKSGYDAPVYDVRLHLTPLIKSEFYTYGSYLNSQPDLFVNLCKWDTSGVLLFQKTYYPFGTYNTNYVNVTKDNGLLLTATHNLSANSAQSIVMKTDSNGNEIWARNYPFNFSNSSSVIKEATNGDLLVTGSLVDTTLNTTNKFYLMRTDSNGIPLYIHSIYIGDSMSPSFYSFAGDSELYLGGFKRIDMYYGNLVISKVNCLTGQAKWSILVNESFFMGYGTMFAEGLVNIVSVRNFSQDYFFYLNNNGNILQTKESIPPLFIYAIDVNRNSVCVGGSQFATFDLNGVGTCFPLTTSPQLISNIITTDTLTSSSALFTNNDSVYIRQPRSYTYQQNVFCRSFVGINEINYDNFNIYPNPAFNNLVINSPVYYNDLDLIIYDMQGRIVLKQNMQGQDFSINLSGISRGSYVVTFITQGEIIQRKLIQKL